MGRIKKTAIIPPLLAAEIELWKRGSFDFICKQGGKHHQKQEEALKLLADDEHVEFLYGGAAGGAEAAKTEFDVVLTSFGDAKMAVIKVAKEVLGLGLKEAKEIVEAAPKALKEGVSEAEANELKAKFEEAGATIELK